MVVRNNWTIKHWRYWSRNFQWLRMCEQWFLDQIHYLRFNTTNNGFCKPGNNEKYPKCWSRKQSVHLEGVYRNTFHKMVRSNVQRGASPFPIRAWSSQLLTNGSRSCFLKCLLVVSRPCLAAVTSRCPARPGATFSCTLHSWVLTSDFFPAV